MLQILQNEPVIAAFLTEILTLVITKYGLNVDGKIVAAIGSVLAALLAVGVRHLVTPVKKVNPAVPPSAPKA